MPELPEVEIIRRGLAKHVSGRRIATVEVLHRRAVRRHVGGAVDFIASTAGRDVGEVRRRGKYFWLCLDGGIAGQADRKLDDDALLVHLGMSGQMLIGPPTRPLSPHVRARFTFTDGGPDLRFTDQRTFGQLLVCPGAATVPTYIAHIARDPLDPDFDVGEFSERLRRRRSGVKRALLDQSLVSGIGNIYADESLWRAMLHPARSADLLRKTDVTRLVEAVTVVLAEALAAGGTTFDSLYVNVNGQRGYYDHSLAVYGRAGLPCPRCGTRVRRDPFMNRSAYSCPSCQRRPRHPHW